MIAYILVAVLLSLAGAPVVRSQTAVADRSVREAELSIGVVERVMRGTALLCKSYRVTAQAYEEMDRAVPTGPSAADLAESMKNAESFCRIKLDGHQDYIDNKTKAIREYRAGALLSVSPTGEYLALSAGLSAINCKTAKMQAALKTTEYDSYLFLHVGRLQREAGRLGQESADILCPIMTDLLDDEKFEFAHSWINLAKGE